MNRKLKIYVLVDNTAGRDTCAEHGLSYIVEYDKKILFDAGQSDLFIKNANYLEVNIDDIETIVLSHGHFDHGNGLHYLNHKNLICHPDYNLERYSGKMRKPVGITQVDELKSKFKIKNSKDPYWISERMVFLGEIPRKLGFEKRKSGFYFKNGEVDNVWDDSAIAVKMKQGIFLISGCAHAGICNTIEYAKKITGESRVFGVIGGFHLKIADKYTYQTLEYFKQNKVKVVMPSHCTELPVLSLFYNEFKGEQVKAGTLYTFDDI